jgi:hypothetical protein
MKNLITRAVYDFRSGRWIEEVSRLYDGPWALAMNNSVLVQTAYRFYDNDAVEASATALGTESTQTTLEVDTEYQVRIRVEDDNNGAANNTSGAFEFAVSPFSAFNAVTTSTTEIQAVDGNGNITEGGDTTERLTDDGAVAGSVFITDNNWQTEDGTAGNCTFVEGSNHTSEAVMSFQIIGSAVSDGDEIRIRIAGLDTYKVAYASIDVNKEAVEGRRRSNVT